MNGEALFRELIEAPDRDHCPGARPVLSYRIDDEAEYLDVLDRQTTRRIDLVRRGVQHGTVVELEESAAPRDGFPIEARLNQRWHEAHPILWRGLLGEEECRELGAPREEMYLALEERRLASLLKELPEGFEALGGQSLQDPDRDVEKVGLRCVRGEHTSRDLWVKSARLSNHEGDASLRLRCSFGSEGKDDGSRDLGRHLLTAELGASVFPESKLIAGHEALQERLRGWIEDEVLLTQHIGYWNAPGGGALFHHDAFDEELVGSQRGVLYTQLVGETAWLAISLNDLALRVREMLEYLEEGELDWVRQALYPREGSFERALKLAGNIPRCKRELARPGCGSLGKLVNRGPEFTSLLADAGHAFVLGPGDAVILPNHGLERTCMHSVFCADENELTFGLSLAIRGTTPPPDPEPPEQPKEADSRPPSLKHQRAQRRRRRR